MTLIFSVMTSEYVEFWVQLWYKLSWRMRNLHQCVVYLTQQPCHDTTGKLFYLFVCCLCRNIPTPSCSRGTSWSIPGTSTSLISPCTTESGTAFPTLLTWHVEVGVFCSAYFVLFPLKRVQVFNKAGCCTIINTMKLICRKFCIFETN